MSETADHDFGHLPPAAAGLGHIFARPKVLAAFCVVALAGLGWFYLALLLAGVGGSFGGFGVTVAALLCRPLSVASWSASGFAVVASMWGAMTLAMMLPSAAPMILTYAEIADTAARKNERIVSPFVLAAGYTVVWFGFSLIAALAQIAFTCGDVARHQHGVGERPVLRRDLYRRRRLPVLRAQARLSHAMPASVPVLLRQLGDHAARRVPARTASKASIASAAAGR